MHHFQITTAQNDILAKGHYMADGVALTWRADYGVIRPQLYANLTHAFKAFKRIAPTAVRVSEVSAQPAPVAAPAAAPHRVWTGGHSPRGAHVQRQRVPTPDEQLAIVDCVD